MQVAVADLSSLAAQRAGGSSPRCSAPALSPEQSDAAHRRPGRIHHRDVQLNVTVDPSVVGGLEVRVGDEVIDGTLSTRLEGRLTPASPTDEEPTREAREQ